MTVLIPCGRTLSKQGLPTTSRLFTRLLSSYPTRRVVYVPSTLLSSKRTCNIQTSRRADVTQAQTYATEATAKSKPKAKPKATTTPKKTKTTTTKKATATKKTPAVKRKSVKRVTKAKAKPKSKPKPKVKPKKKAPSKTALARQASKEKVELRKKALLVDTPKALPDSAWRVCFVENGPKKGEAFAGGNSAKQASQVYRSTTPEEMERLNHIANQNKAKNQRAHQDWLKSFTPAQIKDANNARNTLQRQARAAGKKTTYPHIQDDRVVKHPGNQYAYFVKDRYDSGDFKHMTIAESSKLIGREWKALSASEKKPFLAKQEAELERYVEEYKTVYGKDPYSIKHAKRATS